MPVPCLAWCYWRVQPRLGAAMSRASFACAPPETRDETCTSRKPSRHVCLAALTRYEWLHWSGLDRGSLFPWE